MKQTRAMRRQALQTKRELLEELADLIHEDLAAFCESLSEPVQSLLLVILHTGYLFALHELFHAIQ